MPNAPTLHVSAMEGKGAYNRHAAIPASGGGLAIPFLGAAARKIAIDAGDRPIAIADYGSSQGRNSLEAMRSAISILSQRVGSDRAVLVYHTDLPSNDSSEMFATLQSNPNRYAREDPNVFSCAIGRNFYERLFPSGYVDLGWSSYAAVWLSEIPRQIPDHFFIACCTGALRAEFDRQGDWTGRRFSRIAPPNCVPVDGWWSPFPHLIMMGQRSSGRCWTPRTRRLRSWLLPGRFPPKSAAG